MAKEPVRIDSNGRKIILNGNRLAFLEPMESTAIGFYLSVARGTFDWIIGTDHSLSQKAKLAKNIFHFGTSSEIQNSIIRDHFNQIYTFILWHYIRGSIYDTPFWRTAQAETTVIFKQPNQPFQNIVNLAKSIDYMDCRNIGGKQQYGQWPTYSIKLWYDKYINRKVS